MSQFLIMLMVANSQAGVFPYEIETAILENGLTVHVVPMNSPGLAAYYTWMSVGSRDEIDPGRTGFAHFFEHLMFFGTETTSAEEREQMVMRLGADENAWTWYDETVYHSVLATTKLTKLIDSEADRFQNLLLTADDVEREAGAVYGEFRKSRASPQQHLSNLLYATAFQSHTYSHDTLGYEADIAAMPSAFEYSQQFFDRYYRPENATIFVVGDVKGDEIFSTVEKAYGAWQPTEAAPIEIPVEPPQTAQRRLDAKWGSPTAPRLVMGWKIPGHNPDDPDVAALELVANLLLSPVGPLHQRLVRGEGIAYKISGGRDEFVDPCLFEVSLLLKDKIDLEAAEAIVLEEITSLQQSIKADSLDATRSHMKYDFLSSLNNPGSVASALGWHTRRGRSPDAIDRFYKHYDALTPEEVSEAARRYLVDEGLTVVTLVTEEAP
ncbi:MAG: insulinase family protein [Proteobacteria bacterium]|jgi:zinc protease|nr:insulinase family protein [Pseudomonadota bacterium]